MSDLDLLNSLGHETIAADLSTANPPFLDRAAMVRTKHGWCTIDSYIADESFWLELDDALAKQGWHTTMIHRTEPNAFFYYANKYPETIQSDIDRLTRLEAVRSVYERIHEQKGQQQ